MGTSDMPWAARRRRLLSVPRGPIEWGRLLYEPDWCRRRPVKNGDNLFIAAMLLAMAAVILHTLLYGHMREGAEDLEWVIYVSLVGAAVGSVILVLYELRKMPLRIYEAGLTKEKVPVLRGLFRRGVLVPAEQVEMVRVKSYSRDGPHSRAIAVEYRDEDGSLQAKVLDEEDPLSALIALSRMAPDRLDEEAQEQLDPERLPDGPTSVDDVKPRRMSMIMVMTFSLFVPSAFMVALFIHFFLLAEGVPDLPFLLLGVAVVICLSSFMIAMALRGARTLYHSLFNYSSAEADSEGLKVRVPLLLRTMLIAPSMLPYGRILRARKCLGNRALRPEYQMLVREGEPIDIAPHLHRALTKRPEFERSGFELVNKRPWTGPAEGLARVNLQGLLGLMAVLVAVLLVILSTFLSLDLSDLGEEDESETPSEADRLQMVLYLVMVPFAGTSLVLIYIQTRRIGAIEAAAVGMEVDRTSIRLPGGRKPVGEVRKSDIESIAAVPFRLGRLHVLRVKTRDRTILLPITALEELKENGYYVELPENLQDDS